MKCAKRAIDFSTYMRPVAPVMPPVVVPQVVQPAAVAQQACTFPSNGVAVQPHVEYDELAEFRVDINEDLEAIFESHHI